MPVENSIHTFSLSRWLVIVSALSGVSFLAVDIPLARFFAGINDRGILHAFEIITMLGNPVYWLGGSLSAVIISWCGRRLFGAGFPPGRWLRGCFYVFVSVFGSGLAVFILKEVTGRLRPQDLSPGATPVVTGAISHHLALSFPSGHSAAAFAVATAASIMDPRWRFGMMIAAAAVAASRIVLNAHFLSDVMAGGYIGFATAILFARWFQEAGAGVI